jgi:putative Holliday junction resolvase
MAIINLTDLIAGLARDERLLGIDLGARRVGLALSDARRVLATPYGTLPRRKLSTNAAEIVVIARREGVGGLVVGLPLSMNGTFGPAAQGARDWAFALTAATGLDVALWDERLSTAAVTRTMIDEADLSRTKRAAVVDRSAAAWILQSALDAAWQRPSIVPDDGL